MRHLRLSPPFTPAKSLICCVLAAGTLFRLGASDEPKLFDYPQSMANVLYKVDPAYPSAVHQIKAQTWIQVDAYVNTDGSVYSTVVVSSDTRFIDAAESAVKQWKFKPFEADGHPIRAIARVTFVLQPEKVVTRASR
jgi:hypothetical protein